MYKVRAGMFFANAGLVFFVLVLVFPRAALRTWSPIALQVLAAPPAFGTHTPNGILWIVKSHVSAMGTQDDFGRGDAILDPRIFFKKTKIILFLGSSAVPQMFFQFFPLFLTSPTRIKHARPNTKKCIY